MRVTICAFDTPGNIDGPTSWLKRLIPYLQKNGVTVRVIFLAANSKKLPFYNELKKRGVECKLIFWEIFWEHKVVAILRDLAEFPPDVFVPNYFPVACYAARWAKKAGIPTVIVLHNDDKMHHALVDEFGSKDKENKATAIVGVSRFIKEAIDRKISKDVISEYITCGAPVPPESTVRSLSNPLKLIYAGRLMEHQKQISKVALAFCRVVKEIPGTEAIIYGSGNALKNVVKILDVHGKDLPVSYGGLLRSDEVQHYFLQNHVFILLSDFEGLPISLVEAMACGLVPVCMNTKSGVGEVIKNRENGFLITDREEGFIQVIKEIKNNYRLWQECSAQAKKTIIDSYSDEVCNKKWLDLLQRLAALNAYSGNIKIPALKDLKEYMVPEEFRKIDNRLMSSWAIPFYYMRKKIGRFKRRILE